MINTNNSEAESLFLEVEEGARLCNIGRSTMYGLIKDGTIRSVKIRGRRLIHRQTLLEDAAKLAGLSATPDSSGPAQ